MMPLQLEKLTDYVDGGVNWLHKVLSWLFCQCHQSLAGHKGKASCQCYSLFLPTQVSKYSRGRPYLWTAIGTEDFVISCDGYSSKVDDGAGLVAIALSQPHAAHVGFTHGLSSKWFYLTHSIQVTGSLLQPLEAIIRSKLSEWLRHTPILIFAQFLLYPFYFEQVLKTKYML